MGADGAIDWLCLPRFDSRACFAALLGTADHGRWRIQPDVPVRRRQSYRSGTLVLETEFTAAAGAVRLIDFMSLGNSVADVVRIVEGLDGTVPIRMDLTLRPDYGTVIPWVRRAAARLRPHLEPFAPAAARSARM